MWLLKFHWSNPMKHLIPYLIDDQKAADYLRQLRWPNGVQCPRCRSDAVESRERCDNGLQRFNGSSAPIQSTRSQLSSARCSSFFALTGFARHEPKQNQRIVRD